MTDGLAIGIVDGDIRSALPADARVMARRFCSPGDHGTSIAHGNAVAATVARHVAPAIWANAVVFGPAPGSDLNALSEAIAWLTAEQVSVIVCALGIPVPATPDAGSAASFQQTVADAVLAGICLVAAAPARGQTVWPATLPDVVSVSGDARCEVHEWSYLNASHALWGACVRYDDRHAGDTRLAVRAGGASIATAHFAGHLGSMLKRTGRDAPAALAALEGAATYRGREHRSS